MYELTNKQREYLGLDPIKKDWDRVLFKGDTYRPETILYFEGETIKRHILSTENEYSEVQYDELTSERNVLLPKTNKGKEKKLTASVLEQRNPIGVYVNVFKGNILIGNHNTQTTFYSSRWANDEQSTKSNSEVVSDFIEQSPSSHLSELAQFKSSKRKHVKFRSGDYFCFKFDRTSFGFGRIMLDVSKVRKNKLLIEEHGLRLIMGPPLIVQLFAYKATSKNIDISILDKEPHLPTDLMMDNLLLYGEYEIIGHKDLKDEEFEFPISYGRSLDSQRKIVFLQWGLIHKEISQEKFNKYLVGEKPIDQNPYGYYGIGFRPRYNALDIQNTIENKGVYDFSKSKYYKAKWDLRNPKNKTIKDELFKVFGLDPAQNYLNNCKLTNTIFTTDLIKKL